MSVGSPLRARDHRAVDATKVLFLAGKMMVCVFWDAKGIVFIDYLQKGQAINGEYYAILLKQLWKAIELKCPGKLTKGDMFQQENAPTHKSVVAMVAVRDCGFELVDHPITFSWLGTTTLFSIPKHEKTLGWEAVPDW